MNILVINCGSSSVKYQFIDSKTEKALAKGSVSRIGMSAAVISHTPHDRPNVTYSAEILDHIAAIEYVVSLLASANHGVINDIKEIDAVGHRVVHGGERFTNSVLINSEIMTELRKLIALAPLHNPHNIRGINACIKTLPHAKQVAVFDTAFHHKMPEKAYIYPIPYVFYKRHGIRRYGFHGMSHKYVSERAAKMLDRPIEETKIVTCHLGSGNSATAVNGGVSVDTSMGFTPLEGLVMGTRSGDIDPAIILTIMAREELSLHEANTLLNKHSGLQGISGISSDMSDILEAVEEKRPCAILALDVYCYRIKKYIASYAAAMGGMDAIVFTAGVGENAAKVRELTTDGLEFMGVSVNKAKNKAAKNSQETDISDDDALVRTLVIPTNEELIIARDTCAIIEGKTKEKTVSA